MQERNLPFHDLMGQVITQLKEQGYMDSTIMVYRRFYNRVQKYLVELNTDIYTRNIGDTFLNTLNVSEATAIAYKCAIRRLNDCLDGNPYRCHRENHHTHVSDDYVPVLEEYQEYCNEINNKPATIKIKKRSCEIFLNHLKANGCSNITELTPELVAQALLRE